MRWGDDEPAVKMLRQAFPDARGIAERETWRGPLQTSSRLDYIFARTEGPALQVRRIPERFGSDHYPLMTVITLHHDDTKGVHWRGFATYPLRARTR